MKDRQVWPMWSVQTSDSSSGTNEYRVNKALHGWKEAGCSWLTMGRPLKTKESGCSIGQLYGHGIFAGGSKNLEKEKARESGF